MDNHESTKQLVYTLLERLANTLALLNDVAWNRGEVDLQEPSRTLELWGVPQKLKAIREAPPTLQTKLIETFLVDEYEEVEQDVEWMSEEIAGQKDLIKGGDRAMEVMEEKLDIEAEEIRRLRGLLKNANDSIIDKDYVITSLREDLRALKSTPEVQIQRNKVLEGVKEIKDLKIEMRLEKEKYQERINYLLDKEIKEMKIKEKKLEHYEGNDYDLLAANNLELEKKLKDSQQDVKKKELEIKEMKEFIKWKRQISEEF